MSAPSAETARRARVILAWCFPLGAFLHMLWVLQHGWLYYGPAPPWAVLFWYAICLIDFVVCWLMLTRPRPGLIAGVLTMLVSLVVNWTQFPTFEFKFNWVLIGLTSFGLIYFALTPWLWRSVRQDWIPKR